MKRSLVVVLLVATAGCSSPAPREADRFVAEPAIFATTPAEVKASCDRYLARIATDRAALEGETGPGTFASTLRRYDDLFLIGLSAYAQADVVMATAPDAAVRSAAQACLGQSAELFTDLSLSRPLYDRLKAIDPTTGTAEERFLLARKLRDAELTGTDRDAATRAKIAELQKVITVASLQFERNISDGRKVVKATPAELAGVPESYLAAHKPGPDGLIEVSTDYPDLQPVMTYARDAAFRKRLYIANLTRAWPANDAVLATIIKGRYDMARLLGRPDFASLDLATRMLNTPAKARAFIDGVSQSAAAPAQRDLALLVARLRQDDPTITTVPPWSARYAMQLLRKERFEVDPQEIRKYFAYPKVRDGIFRLTEDLFGVTIRPWDTKVWTPAVQAYEMMDGGEVIGRFYLDNHPRPGKYNHNRIAVIRTGIAGRAVPVGAMIAAFPDGLMEHHQVETFLHEFGHMLHLVFSGKREWAMQNGFFGLEPDFGEAPSTMLENWVWDYNTIKRFATNTKGGAIPEALVARMNRARSFAEAYSDTQQLGVSAVSLGLYTGAPPTDLTRAYLNAYNHYDLIPITGVDVHPHASLGHLTGYGSAYYTYLWSKAISTDLLTEFEANGLRDRATAQRYRDLVLAAGSSKPANMLVTDFLGRPLSLTAYRKRLTR